MICAWDAYVNLLPLWLRNDADKLGAEKLQELHLRIGFFPTLITNEGVTHVERVVTDNDIHFVINTASKYSPWAADTLKNGYITAMGGHRIGVCGVYATEYGKAVNMQSANMLCMRVARDFEDISAGIDTHNRSVIVIGRPGCGKTTLLRDLIRRHSRLGCGNVGVVDERCELFPIAQGRHCFTAGCNTDVLSGVEKQRGIEMLLRCMNPDVIAVDEITSSADSDAVIEACGCGVRLFATAHAGSRDEFYHRPIYRGLIASRIFDSLVIMRPDKSWYVEEMSTNCYA